MSDERAIALLLNAEKKCRVASNRYVDAVTAIEFNATSIKDQREKALRLIAVGDDRLERALRKTGRAVDELSVADPETYVYQTPEEWSFTPENGSDVFQLQSSGSVREFRGRGLFMPPIPQRSVVSYSVQLRLTGRPTETRNVLAWVVAGTGVPGDNDQKFSDLVWVRRGDGIIRWRMGFGVGQEEQEKTETRAPWLIDQDAFSVLHEVHLGEALSSSSAAALRGGRRRSVLRSVPAPPEPTFVPDCGLPAVRRAPFS